MIVNKAIVWEVTSICVSVPVTLLRHKATSAQAEATYIVCFEKIYRRHKIYDLYNGDFSHTP